MLTVHANRHESVRLFNLLAIETGAQCNRACVFCPNHTTTRPDEYMTMSLIDKMLYELRALNYSGRITPYIYNEPLRDKRALDILRQMREILPRARVMVSTNGDYLHSVTDVKRLLDAGVRQLLINIYSAADGSGKPDREARGVAIARKRHATVQGWVDSLGDAVDQRGSVYQQMPLSARPRIRIEAKYGVTQKTAKLARFELQNRSGNIAWFQRGLTEPLAKHCVRPWRALNVNWRGEAVLCCNDYHGDVVIGSVRTQSLVEIWNSELMTKYRIKLLAKKRDATLCDKCDYSGGAYPHMVQPVTLGREADRAIVSAPLHSK